MTRRLALLAALGLFAAAGLAAPRPAAAQDHVEEEGGAEDVHSASPVAQKLFHDIVCMCGGCKRETLFKCTCAYARQERQKVLAILAQHDLSTKDGEKKAYDAVIKAFIDEYGGQHVLTVPLDQGFNRLMWIVPYVAFPLALVMVFMIGRSWVRRGRLAQAQRGLGVAGAGAAGSEAAVSKLSADERDALEDKLDDELRDVD